MKFKLSIGFRGLCTRAGKLTDAFSHATRRPHSLVTSS
jgi:hypothetical protein